MARKIRYVLIGLLALFAIVFGAPGWLASTDTPILLRALAYSFFHANLFHLAANSLAIWFLYRTDRRGIFMELLTAYIIAVASYLISSKFVIGFSNILFAVIGLRSPALGSKWWTRRETLIFFVINILTLFMPSLKLSAVTHIAAFIVGAWISGIRRFFDRILKDARRYY